MLELFPADDDMITLEVRVSLMMREVKFKIIKNSESVTDSLCVTLCQSCRDSSSGKVISPRCNKAKKTTEELGNKQQVIMLGGCLIIDDHISQIIQR